MYTIYDLLISIGLSYDYRPLHGLSTAIKFNNEHQFNNLNALIAIKI